MKYSANLKFSLLLLISLSILIACKKNDPVPVYEQKATLLAGEKGQSKSWKLIAYNYTGPDRNIDIFNSTDFGYDVACTRDDIYKFTNNANQEYESSEGATKCSNDDTQIIEKGTWFFSNDAVWINITPDQVNSNLYGLFSKLFYDENFLYLGVAPGKIVELTETSLKVEVSYNNGSQSLKLSLNFTKL